MDITTITNTRANNITLGGFCVFFMACYYDDNKKKKVLVFVFATSAKYNALTITFLLNFNQLLY